MNTVYEIKCTEDDLFKLFSNAINTLKQRKLSERYRKLDDYKTFRIEIRLVSDNVSKRGIF